MPVECAAPKNRARFVVLAYPLRVFFQYRIESTKRNVIPNLETSINAYREEMTKLIVILLLAFACGCRPPASHRLCSELETDPSVPLDEYYSYCRAHSTQP